VKVSRNGVASKSGLMSMTHIDNAQDPHFHPIEVLVANRRRRMCCHVGKSMPSNSTLRQGSLLPGITHTSGPAWPAAAVICVSSLAVSDQHGLATAVICVSSLAVSDQHGLATAVICVSSLAVSDQHGRGWRSPVSNLEWTAWASSNSAASRVTSVAD
jgi:hypothetical protein